MRPIELARRAAELQQHTDAQRAFTLALEDEERTPEEELEAASYIFFSQGDYKVAYTTFVSLYRRGLFRAELLDLMTQAFYTPNEQDLRQRYEDNCSALAAYPYCFHTEFLPFEALPIRFFPFDDESYLPYDRVTEEFGDCTDFREPVIRQNFFKDLEKPILARDVYSQYELEYLNDNVRKSEWVGRENHIYLHYTDWTAFCTYLQVLDVSQLLKEEKLVFLIGDEVAQYPIDFPARFGIDYSQYTPKPIEIREVKRLIWHTQLSSHNGGDFFNEILYGHPNLLTWESLLMDSVEQSLVQLRKDLRHNYKSVLSDKTFDKRVTMQLAQIKHITDKDLLVALFLGRQGLDSIDHGQRIVPALLFQPHFLNIDYDFYVDNKNGLVALGSDQYDQIRSAPFFQEFQYIKTFTPMRRPTTSYAASIRFMRDPQHQKRGRIMVDAMRQRLLNRSFMVDPWDRLYHDSVLVRFEDGKLNPRATFTALAEFLDLPYTESMTYCSGRSGINPESLRGNVLGFDTATVYRTYDEYASDDERALLEYFYRDVYQYYGYDFHYYNGEPVDQAWVEEKLQKLTCLDKQIDQSLEDALRLQAEEMTDKTQEELEAAIQAEVSEKREQRQRIRHRVIDCLLKGLEFVNRQGQPLRLMKKLELDPALLEQPLYH